MKVFVQIYTEGEQAVLERFNVFSDEVPDEQALASVITEALRNRFTVEPAS